MQHAARKYARFYGILLIVSLFASPLFAGPRPDKNPGWYVKFHPDPGTYTNSVTVEVDARDRNAEVHFTLDGSEPTQQSPVYSSPLALSEPTTVKVMLVTGNDTPVYTSAAYDVVRSVEPTPDPSTTTDTSSSGESLPVNSAPVAMDDATSTLADKAVVIAVMNNDSDPDGDVLTLTTYEPVSVNGGSITTNSDQSLTYTPPAGFSGDDTFTYTISDLEYVDTATVSIVVNAPVTSHDTGSVVWFDNYEPYQAGYQPPESANDFGMFQTDSGNPVIVDATRSRSGNQAVYAYLNRDLSNNLYRTESVPKGGPNLNVRTLPLTNQVVAYQLSVYVPADYVADYASGETLSQWHPNQDIYGNHVGGQPTVALRLHAGNWRLVVRHGESGNDIERWWDEGELPAVVPGQWYDFRFEMLWRSDSQGRVRMWMNDIEYVDHTGPNIYVEENLTPFWKFGVYKTSWRSSIDNGDEDIRERHFWFDDLEMKLLD